MSRTGNLLFPDDADDGWVTAVIKALPQDNPQPPPDPRLDEALKTVSPDALNMVDPVGIEAESKFSAVAAETAQHDAIFAAGWSAQVTGPVEGAPPAPGAGAFSPEALDALDAVIARDAGHAGFSAVDDPVAIQADSAFAGVAAETATRDAIQAAGWKTGTVTPHVAQPDAELQTLDQLTATHADDAGFAQIDDPIAHSADARFAESAAEIAQRDALAATGWSAEPHLAPAAPPALAETAPADLKELDQLADIAARDAGFAHIDDPISLSADARFAEAEAANATREAMLAAGWKAGAVPPTEQLAAAPPPTDNVLREIDRLADAAAQDPDFAHVADPISLSADARFAEAEAANAAKDAMFAAGWKAGAVPPTEQLAVLPPSPDEIEDLDRLADGTARLPGFAHIDDPVGHSADARFAETAAQVAVRDAVLAARALDDKAAAAEAFAAADDLKSLDAIARRLGPDAVSPVDDPLGVEANARFAQIAADVATRDAIRAAQLEDLKAAQPAPSSDDVRALDALAARNALAAAQPVDDPVANEAAARFAEQAADLAIADALFAAGWQPNALSADTQVAKILRQRRDLESLEIEDLVRAEAEIAFEDAAYDIAYARVDSLATGEAAALAAFDQAIAAGLDPDEALQLAIAAAEEMDPRVFGGLARVSTLPGDFELIGAIPRSPVVEQTLAELPPPTPEAQLRDQPVITISDLGSGFRAITGQPLILGATGSDTLNVPGFKFVFDPAVISRPGSNFHFVEHADLILIPRAAGRTESQGSAAADLIVGDDGNDAIAGLAGDDYLYGDRPTNYVAGTHDATNPLTNPTFSSSGGDDVISGGPGDDTIWGGPGNDIIDGDVTVESGVSGEFSFFLGDASSGNDVIDGGEGDDTLWGGGGNDVLYGGAGNDNIFGYTGDDVLVGGTGIDVLTGGTGADEFRFQGGTGATSLAHAQSLGTDVVKDFSEAEGDTLGLSNADFGLGAAGTLTDGTDYFEHAPAALSASPLDASGGHVGAAVVVLGDGAGSDGVKVYYTDDASAMTDANSYQIADVKNVNLAQIEAGDFHLRT